MAKPEMRFIVVFDIGKTNAKVILFDRHDGREAFSRTESNEILPAPPYRHHDAERLEAFFLESLAEIARDWVVDAIAVATHGACAALVNTEGLVLPVLDYDDPGPDELATDYEAMRPEFAVSGSPRFAAGLNLGAQIFWQKSRFPEDFARVEHVLMWPQYWAWRLSGVAAGEATSLACHNDLWDLQRGRLSQLVTDGLGIAGLFPPVRAAFDVLGPLRPEHARRAGIDGDLPVLCGVHDSNAALIPHIVRMKGPTTILSTGTWITAFALGTEVGKLPARDGVMAGVDVFGKVVPSFRFPGGRIYDRFRLGDGEDAALLRPRTDGVRMKLPAEGSEFGIIDRHGAALATSALSEGELAVMASTALAERTLQGLTWIGAEGPTIVMGPFADNGVFLAVLRESLPDDVVVETGHGGISEGAAMLAELGQEQSAHD